MSWDTAATARAYARFCGEHGRYPDASGWLVDDAIACLRAAEPASRPLRVLDWGAGTGVTTSAWCRRSPWDCELVAWEPSAAMAAHHPAAARLRVDGVRVRLVERLPPPGGRGFDVVLGSSMWWLLRDPAAALAGLAPWLTDDALVAWSTPAAYLGDPPDGGEIALAAALDEARREAGLPLPAVAPHEAGARLDPSAALAVAGFEVLSERRHTRACSAAEWCAHTALPPVRPPWLRGQPQADALLSSLADRVASQPPHAQVWHVLIARRTSRGRAPA